MLHPIDNRHGKAPRRQWNRYDDPSFRCCPNLRIGSFAFAVSKGVQQVQDARRDAIANLAFEDVNSSRRGSYMYLKGRVRNNGSTEAEFVKVELDWLDKEGSIVDTGETFVVGVDKLEPGAAKSFEIMAPANSKIARYSYKFASH